MALVVFAAGIERFHLHERLARELQQDGHTTHTLCADPIEHTFWLAQGSAVSVLRERASDPREAPLDEMAQRECRRLGLRADDRHHRRCVQRLSRLLPAALAWFEQHEPDLLLLHQRRCAEHHLLAHVARETGTRVLWTGDGLLPHTLQVDERGLDGDAASLARRARDYRVVQAQRPLLDACLAGALAHTSPFALSRREVMPPALGARLADLGRALCRGDWGPARSAFFAWRRAEPAVPAAAQPAAELPRHPFVALLLQDATDERMRLDAPGAPTHRELIHAAAEATAAADRGLRLLVIAPPRGLERGALAGLGAGAQLHFAPASRAPEAAATALATLTVNHPLAIVALLAGTPVVHTGSALYGLPGVATRAATGDLAAALPAALARDFPALRRRFLSWLFQFGHVWCSSTEPDHNGIAGFVAAVESRLPAKSPPGARRRYQPGPVWPLAAERRGP